MPKSNYYPTVIQGGASGASSSRSSSVYTSSAWSASQSPRSSVSSFDYKEYRVMGAGTASSSLTPARDPTRLTRPLADKHIVTAKSKGNVTVYQGRQVVSDAYAPTPTYNNSSWSRNPERAGDSRRDHRS